VRFWRDAAHYIVAKPINRDRKWRLFSFDDRDFDVCWSKAVIERVMAKPVDIVAFNDIIAKWGLFWAVVNRVANA
jgi:hypothetical protein